MKNTEAESGKMIADLRQVALGCPDTEETVSCKGTAIQSATFKTRGKSFLFLRPGNVMVKLDRSLVQAERLAAKYPTCLKVGKGAWTTITAPGSKEVPLSLIKRWIKESHAMFSSSKCKRKKTKKKK